jgi:cyclase
MKPQLFCVALFLGLTTLAMPASSVETVTLDDMLSRFGWSFENTEIKSEKVADGLFVLFGLGGNIAVSIGDQGVLIVDDQFPQLMPKIEAAIKRLGGANIDFVINTHGHFDHAEGNLALGPAGAKIVSHDNARDMMRTGTVVNLVSMHYEQPPYPSAALPVVTYSDRMKMHFNGEAIELLHTGPAHTNGDTAVLFRGRNAAHLGDAFNNTGFPFIDADNGGGIDGMIAFCRAVRAELADDAIVIPGHGAVTDTQTLDRYIEMLQITRDRIAKHVAAGMDLSAVIAADPTRGFTAKYGDAEATLRYIDRVYASLSRDTKQ